MESALGLPGVTRVVFGYTGYKNAIGAASRTLRRGWTEANIVSPKAFVFSQAGNTKNYQRVFALDFRNCTWSEMAPFPGGEKRKYFFQSGGAVYLLATDVDIESKIFKYDMRTDIWTEIAEFPGFSFYGVQMVGEDLYMIGCPNEVDAQGPELLKKFNLASGVLSSSESPLPWGHPDPEHPLEFSLTTTESSGFIYVTYSRSFMQYVTEVSDDDMEHFARCWMLDPGTGAWTSLPDTPTHSHCAVNFENDIVVLGGFRGNNSSTAAVWRLSQVAQVWTRLPDMSFMRLGGGAVVFEGCICAFGGFDEEFYEEDEAIPGEIYSAEILDLSAGAWKPLPRMPYNFAAESCFAAVFSGTEGTP